MENERYCAIILDQKTGLEWVVGGSMTWYEAKSWVKNLSVMGGGWRLPTKQEVLKLYEPKEKYGIHPIFKIDNFIHVWGCKYPKNSSYNLVAEPAYFGFSSQLIDWESQCITFAVR